MKTKNIILTCIVGLAFLVSCRKDYLTTSDISTPVDPSQPISYAATIEPIWVANCLGSGCHVSGGPSPVLEVGKSYDQLTQLGYVDADTPDTIPANSKLYKRLIDTAKPMPTSGKMSSSKIQSVALWIQQGAQNK